MSPDTVAAFAERQIIMMKKFKSSLALVSCSMLLLLGGCSSGAVTVEQQSTTAAERENPTAKQQEQAVSEHLDSIVGEWNLLVMQGDEYYQLAEDLDSAGSLDIYVEDGKYKIDYLGKDYGYSEYYGMELKEVAKPKTEGNDAADWYAEFSRKKAENYFYDIVKLTDDTLKLHIHTTYSYEDSGKTTEESYDNYYIYVRKDSPDLEQIIFDYRYTNTVTVSTIKELYEAIQSNTHIILKEGIYNISQLPPEERENPNLNYWYDYETDSYITNDSDTIAVKYVNDLLIEGEKGAAVKICTEEFSEAPLLFDGCNHISLVNLTLGHEVEPGHCSGAVLSLNNSNSVDVKQCRLYGSGTYGVEAYGSYAIHVEDCRIYECTYGLVSLNSSGDITFKNCNMNNSTGYNMFYMNSSWNVAFENCAVTDNTSAYEDSPFICSYSGNAAFTNCTFTGNKYGSLYVGDVVFESCSFSD